MIWNIDVEATLNGNDLTLLPRAEEAQTGPKNGLGPINLAHHF